MRHRNDEAIVLTKSDRLHDAGFTLVFFALAVVALMGIAALVVDLGYWYLRADQIQRTADSAALAGVVYMPGDFTKATDIADKVAESNGFSSGVTVSQVPGQPHQLAVSITDKNVSTFFANVFGIHKITETRHSTAEFQPPIPLGSAENSFGTGDLSLGAGDHTNIWAAVNGYCTSKENGDEFLSAFDATWDGSAWECGATGNAHATANTEYNPGGYTYDIQTPGVAGTPLTSPITVQAYDPGYNPNGCGPGGAETPDSSLGGPNTTITTTFDLLYSPNPSNPSGDTALSSITYGTNNATFTTNATSCGQWAPIGVISGGLNGTYQLTVSTQADEPNSDGTNAYGLRVFQGSSFIRCSTQPDPGYPNPLGDLNQCPVIQGDSALSVYANESGTTATFYLAQIDASYANHTLQVSLFDPGEGNKDIELIDPDGNKVPFFWLTTDDVNTSPPCPDCAPDLGFLHYAVAAPDGTTDLDVSGTLAPPLPAGQLSNSQFNDRHVELTFFIPPDYTADNGGWWKIKYISGGTVTDRTTWSVSVNASPVHLVP